MVVRKQVVPQIRSVIKSHQSNATLQSDVWEQVLRWFCGAVKYSNVEPFCLWQSAWRLDQRVKAAVLGVVKLFCTPPNTSDELDSGQPTRRAHQPHPSLGRTAPSPRRTQYQLVRKTMKIAAALQGVAKPVMGSPLEYAVPRQQSSRVQPVLPPPWSRPSSANEQRAKRARKVELTQQVNTPVKIEPGVTYKDWLLNEIPISWRAPGPSKPLFRKETLDIRSEPGSDS